MAKCFIAQSYLCVQQQHYASLVVGATPHAVAAAAGGGVGATTGGFYSSSSSRLLPFIGDEETRETVWRWRRPSPTTLPLYKLSFRALICCNDIRHAIDQLIRSRSTSIPAKTTTTKFRNFYLHFCSVRLQWRHEDGMQIQMRTIRQGGVGIVCARHGPAVHAVLEQHWVYGGLHVLICGRKCMGLYLRACVFEVVCVCEWWIDRRREWERESYTWVHQSGRCREKLSEWKHVQGGSRETTSKRALSAYSRLVELKLGEWERESCTFLTERVCASNRTQDPSSSVLLKY